MGHDANQVCMGSSQSTFKVVENHRGALAAGLVATLKSDDSITTTLADGVQIGVSLGNDLSGANAYCPIVKKGTGIPILLDSNAVNPVIGAQVQVHSTNGKAVASGTAVNAVYVSNELDAVLEDGSIVVDGCALIDFPGGL